MVKVLNIGTGVRVFYIEIKKSFIKVKTKFLGNFIQLFLDKNILSLTLSSLELLYNITYCIDAAFVFNFFSLYPFLINFIVHQNMMD